MTTIALPPAGLTDKCCGHGIAMSVDDETLRFDGLPSVRGAPGIAAGEFVLPDDFDADNELIANLFECKQ